jgi:hypothetical protein
VARPAIAAHLVVALSSTSSFRCRFKLRLEPGGLRRHEQAGVGDVHELAHRGRVQRKGDRGAARIDAALEFAEAPHAADETDARVGAGIGNAEQRRDDPILQQAHVEAADKEFKTPLVIPAMRGMGLMSAAPIVEAS